jgi:hypothetical protein
MKRYLKLIGSAGLFCAGFLLLQAADAKIVGGPKGGRLLEKTEPRAEFLVEKDRAVSIHFYDAKLKAVPVASQQVTVIAEAKDAKSRLAFEPKDGSLASTSKLPEGEGYTVVVQFKQSADAKPQNFRFKLDLHTCGGCQRAEYACTCGH